MTEKVNTYHIPVLREACIEGLNIHAEGTYVDVTFGGGGHSRAIFENLNEQGFLFGLDQDSDAKSNIWSASNFEFIQSNFSFLSNQLRARKVDKVDGILADLGVSSHQFDVPERGFSIRGQADLDMRMNKTASTTAADLINDYEEEVLIEIFKKYGEIKNARKLASVIIQQRVNQPIRTTQEFIELLSKLAPKFKEHKYYSQVFQALRIEVNKELEVLESFLTQAADLLNPGGRLVVISYHSLEDRIVKNFMKRGNFEGVLKKDFYGNPIKPLSEVNRKPITPDSNELTENTRSRSAKLRIAEKMGKVDKSSNGTDKSVKSGKDANALTQILNGEFLTKSFVLNNLPYIFFILLLLIVFVAKGYYVKQLNDEIKINETELNQNAAEYIEAKTKLEEETKRYKLVEKLQERELKESLNATKVIRIKK